MANLQIKGVDDVFYARIKALADSQNRSISQQVLFLIKDYLAKDKAIRKVKPPAQALLELIGSWADTRDADEILGDLKTDRTNSRRLSKGF